MKRRPPPGEAGACVETGGAAAEGPADARPYATRRPIPKPTENRAVRTESPHDMDHSRR